ncbi:SDR family NAD(P)-dependent oxidoreductase [Nocardioides daeguensis]|uniref:SDR family NAD(P)-dependent oxidoreductase n=1 Tax=Nocardioides daeguensis TaxID=908359 RepID=A0ABP6UXU0_9ACTN|nr:SDR family NAD(P)-dependent oxidoreductase [Nocardioides daeguensis]MBV6728719.1 SDR family NAD(P)-dependent oxidoreductase [Nocardioides daeguensis]MCR1773671.1 SDR family NAD(P)-dependent oxidoreductase [Nocardioides daeguensis]
MITGSPRRAIVTGAGPRSIGRAVADALLADGWDVVVTRRDTLDLADRASVAAFAASYAEQADRLDLLVNSAGIHLDLGSRWKEPQLVDGHEIHWRTNYLGTVDLTTALLPLLLAAPSPTVVHLVSQLHDRGTTDQLLGRPVDYDSWASYGTSKLGLVHHAALLAETYGDRGLRALAVHPGSVSTNIANRGLETRPLLRRLRNLALPLERRTLMTPEESAAHLVRIATDPSSGSGYYRKSRPVDPAPAAGDLAAREALAATTEAWLAGGSGGR